MADEIDRLIEKANAYVFKEGKEELFQGGQGGTLA
jgi:hypothetical protein